MPKKIGNEYLLWIESATAGTFNLIKGQQDGTINRSASTIDTSSKEDYPYGTSSPGSRSVTIPFTYLPNLPDASGHGRFEAIANASTPTSVKIQIRKGGATAVSNDAIFEAVMYITEYTTDLSANSAVKVTATLTLASPPTIDALA